MQFSDCKRLSLYATKSLNFSFTGTSLYKDKNTVFSKTILTDFIFD